MDSNKVTATPMSKQPPTMRRTIRLCFVLIIGVAYIYFAQALDIDKFRAAFLRVVKNAPEERFSAWRDLLAKSQSMTSSDKLTKVNDFINRQTRFADDQEVWGKSDYWATPMETLAKGAGDCEDFAIAKYYTLLTLGIPVDQLRLTYVRARIGGPSSSIVQAHMILAYYPTPDEEPLILDNLIGSIYPASRRPDLQPVFSFNNRFIYQSSTSSSVASSAATAPTSRLSRWQDLLQRAHDEGFDQ